MSVYVVAIIDIHDRDRYARYEAGFMEIFQRFDGEMLAVDEQPRVLEGDYGHTRTVLIRFPSDTALDAWYGSDAYQALLQHRLAASTGTVLRLRGLD